MLILSLLSIINSSAVAFTRDIAILYARIVISILVSCFLLNVNCYYPEFLEKGLGLFSGIYQTAAMSHLFIMFIFGVTGIFSGIFSGIYQTAPMSHLFILFNFLVTGLILQLNGFYPRKA